MSCKPYRPAVNDRVTVRGCEGEWVVVKGPVVGGGYVVGPADGGSMRRIVTALDCEPWQDPAEAAAARREEIVAAVGSEPKPPPRWAMQVLDELLADWHAAWEQHPAVLRGMELAANLAATVAARWVLAADPELVAELAVDLHSDHRPQAIGALASVVLPFGLQQLQQQQPT